MLFRHCLHWAFRKIIMPFRGLPLTTQIHWLPTSWTASHVLKLYSIAGSYRVEPKKPSWATCKRTRKWRISCYPNLRGYSKRKRKNSRKNVSPLCSIWTISVATTLPHWQDYRSCRIQAEHGRGIKVWPVAVTSLPTLPNWMPALLCWPVSNQAARRLPCRRMPLPISIRKLWRNIEKFSKHRKTGWSLQGFPEVSCNIYIWSLCPANKFRLPIKPPILIICPR